MIRPIPRQADMGRIVFTECMLILDGGTHNEEPPDSMNAGSTMLEGCAHDLR